MLCVRGDLESTIRIGSVRAHKGRLLIVIDGVADLAAAEAYIGATLRAPRSLITLGEGEYLDDDLIGCSVERADGKKFGTVQHVEHFPASDMLVVGGHMVPMVGAIVVSIDVSQRRIVIDPPEGLLD